MLPEQFADWQKASADFTDLAKCIPAELQTQPGACGEWSSKELIAHFAGWNREAVRRFKQYADGHKEPVEYDEDAFNAQSVAALKLFNWRETFETYRQTVEELEDIAQTLTAEQWASTKRFGLWFAALARDLRAHSEELSYWLGEQG
jgi:hypothetical protein